MSPTVGQPQLRDPTLFFVRAGPVCGGAFIVAFLILVARQSRYGAAVGGHAGYPGASGNGHSCSPRPGAAFCFM